MLDAVYLARAIDKSDDASLLPNLKAYQDEVKIRGTEAVIKSRAATQDEGQETEAAWKKLTK